MKPILDRDFLERALCGLPKSRYNRYYWWRRYENKEPLSKKAPLYEKIANGDYDPSAYLYQAEMELYLMRDKLSKVKHPDEAHDIRGLFMERYRKLILDYEKQEAKTMQSLVTDFCKVFKLDRKWLLDFMSEFEGTLLEMYDHFKLATKK